MFTVVFMGCTPFAIVLDDDYNHTFQTWEAMGVLMGETVTESTGLSMQEAATLMRRG